MARTMCVSILTILAVALVGAQASDGYNHGIAKHTYSGSDPVEFFAFMAKYFPIHCQDSMTVCNSSFNCGSAGRGVLCSDESCSYPHGLPSAFGLHFANLSARPSGYADNKFVEQVFTDRITAAVNLGKYDSFMDFSTVLYSPSLDDYVTALQQAGVQFLLLSWADDEAQRWYSLVVQVGKSQMILEIVSARKPQGTGRIRLNVVDDQAQRLPASVFKTNNVSARSSRVLIPLAVSKAISDIDVSVSWYTTNLFAKVAHSHVAEDGSFQITTLALPGANALVRFVERPSQDSEKFTVVDLEKAKHYAHNVSFTDIFCGVDKWYDNHFAYDQNLTYLDVFKANFDKNGDKYHIFGDCKASSNPGPGTNIYVVDPSGDAVQIDGTWMHCPAGGSGDALQNPCSQGNCKGYTPSSSCETKLRALCGTKLSNSSCTDCAYGDWVTLQHAGCRNADIVNHCVSPDFIANTLLI